MSATILAYSLVYAFGVFVVIVVNIAILHTLLGRFV